MNRLKWIIVSFLTLSLLLWPALGQASELSSLETRQELEIMKGVLETTLKFSAQTEGQGDEEFGDYVEFGVTSVEGFFLYGQGAVFLVNLPGSVGSFNRNLASFERDLQRFEETREANEFMLQSMEEQLRASTVARERQREAMREYREQAYAARNRQSGEPAPPPAPSPPVHPQPPEAPEPPLPPEPELAARLSEEELDERMAVLEERLAEKKARFERQSQEMEKTQAKMEEALLAAVAKHGDSLTTVKRPEYINLIFASGGARFLGRRGSQKTKVLSIPKSAILDFKAGSIDLATFKQRVVRYEI